MRYFEVSFALVALLTSAVVGVAGTINVPQDYETIQAGINAAVDGDTVLVAAGTYAGTGNRDIEFGGRAIVVMSEDGPGVTVIDCEGSLADPHRGFYFNSGEVRTSVLQGFTIRNGFVWEDYGGAIYCNNASPTIKENIIVENTAGPEWLGGGGGIACLLFSSPIIVSNVIKGNAGGYTSGGIFCYYYSSPTIRGNIIAENNARAAAGILCSYGSTPLIEENIITRNSVIGFERGAGGILCYESSSAVIRRNTITENQGGWGGGGIICQFSSSPSIVGNTIAGNTAKIGGGIYSNYSSSPIIWNNTIVENEADSIGGGSYFSIDSSPSIVNTILWNNNAAQGKEIYLGSTTDPSTLTIGYSDIEGGESSVFVEPGCTLNWGPGMIDVDPSFAVPDKRDYRLLWESGCIDAGHPDSLDQDGTRCDVGAFCFDQDDYLTIYITPDTYEVGHGDQAGVTYTAISRMPQPEMFWILTQAVLPDGRTVNIQGPRQYTLPAHYTAQVYVSYRVRDWFPVGISECWSRIGVPPGTLYDQDRFTFLVTQ